MTIEAYYDSPKMLKRLHEGPLGVHIDLFAARLLREGHCRQSAWRNLRVACDFSHWLAHKRLGLRDINEQSIDKYSSPISMSIPQRSTRIDSTAWSASGDRCYSCQANSRAGRVRTDSGGLQPISD